MSFIKRKDGAMPLQFKRPFAKAGANDNPVGKAFTIQTATGKFAASFKVARRRAENGSVEEQARENLQVSEEMSAKSRFSKSGWLRRGDRFRKLKGREAELRQARISGSDQAHGQGSRPSQAPWRGSNASANLPQFANPSQNHSHFASVHGRGTDREKRQFGGPSM